MMKLGLFLGVYKDFKNLDESLRDAAERGYEAVEIAVDCVGGQIELSELLNRGVADSLRNKIESYGLTISALSNHAESQLVLGPHNSDTDYILKGTPQEKVDFAINRVKLAAKAANALEVPVVCGFCGCEDYSRWFPWPDPFAWEKMAAPFVQRWNDILDDYSKYGVKFAHECHPRQYAYNIETAELTVSLLENRPEWGFNLDPANLLLAGVDPVVFVQCLGDRVLHVHAKDGEIVAHNARRSGLLAHGDWSRIDRGFRFRIPGWGDVSWKRLFTELALVGYDYVVTVEHEDPIIGRLDGIQKAIEYLKPLVIHERPDTQRWW